MASLTWRRGGWELRYRDRSGQEQTERFRGPQTRKPPAEAVERKHDVARVLRRGTYIPVHARRVTFGEYYDRWHARRRVSATRAHTDEGRAKLHVLPHWRTWRLEEIRPSDIDDWISDLSTKMGPTSVRHCCSLLRGPLRRAVKDRIIDDPCIDIVLAPKPEIRKTFDDVLTAEELDRLVAAIADVGEKYSTHWKYRSSTACSCSAARRRGASCPIEYRLWHMQLQVRHRRGGKNSANFVVSAVVGYQANPST